MIGDELYFNCYVAFTAEQARLIGGIAPALRGGAMSMARSANATRDFAGME